MKNIHILSTDKPSRLSINCQTNLLQLGLENRMFHDDINIYITSDEEIKEGDWVIFKGEDGRDRLMRIEEYCWTTDERKIYKMVGGGLTSQDMSKKIILTTNQDLIKDGVQAIDDEFLEWFVKNPSCEYVDLIGLRKEKGYEFLGYEIIIPKEEPKQDLPIVNGSYGCTIQTKKQEPKQETLEEKLTSLVLVDPSDLTLTSDGYGQFPNGYKLTKQGIDKIIKLLKQ